MPSPTPFPAFENLLRRSRNMAGSAAATQSARQNRGAFADIDKLIGALAEHDPAYRNQAVKHSGSVAIALDSMTRWMERAEERFVALAARGAQTEKLLIQVASLAAGSRQHELVEARRQAAEALDAARKVQLAETHRQADHRLRVVALTGVVDRIAETLIGLDQKISSLELRVSKRPDDLIHHIQGLATHLDAHMRRTAEDATTAKQHFDAMTSQIEIFAAELRQLRENHRATASVQPDRPPYEALPPQSASAASDIHRAQAQSGGDGATLRSGLIAAARQANRTEERPSHYFLRQTEPGKN